MKKTPRFRGKTKGDANAEVIARLKQARLASCTTLQEAATKLRISMSTMWWMEHGECPMTAEQADALARFYGERVCSIAANVAAVLGS